MATTCNGPTSSSCLSINLIFALLILSSVASFAQAPAGDSFDSLGLSRQKAYSSYRASSGNRYVYSNEDDKHIMPGETLVIADLKGPGMIAHIWSTVAENEFAWPRLLRLRVYYDGHKTPSVDVPYGDFFAVGHGAERDVNSMMVRNSSFGRARNSYWPMPFRKSCRLTITNEGRRIVPSFFYHIDYRKYVSLPNDVDYFHAYYRQERPARSGRNYAFLDIKGSGHYVGTVMNVNLTQISWFGEGDDLFYIDGAMQPQIYGTGTEDYFNDAWDLRDASGPWTGTPMAEGELPGSRVTAYRWHVPDPVVFTKSLWAGIEHSGWTANSDGSVRAGFEQRGDYFSSVAFWYQKGINEDLPELPYGNERLPYGNATQIAVEDSIQDVTTEKGEASVLREVDWSKDLLLFKAQGEGSKINIPLDIAVDGRYEIVAQLAQGADYGDYTAMLDGQLANVDTRKPATSENPLPGPEIFHNYLNELYLARDHTLGIFTLSKGRHTLSFTCVGKESRSVGYNLGVNEIVLEQVPENKDVADFPPVEGAKPEASAGDLYRGHPLSFFLAGLKRAPENERAAWIRALGNFGASGTLAVSALSGALADQSEEVRIAAAWSLSQIGQSAAGVVPVLGKALSDANPWVRDLAALALKDIGPKAAAAVPQLITALSDPVNFVRSPAADALGAIGPEARQAVAALEDTLKDKDGIVRTRAAFALGDIGPDAHDAIPLLQQTHGGGRLSAAAQEAILKIEGKPVPMYHK
jgi:hypothetical protein